MLLLLQELRIKTLAKRAARFEWPKLRELLTSPLLRLYYVSYLSQAHNLENLRFIEDVQQFREKAAGLQDHSSKIRALANPIVEKYIVTDAPSQACCFCFSVLFVFAPSPSVLMCFSDQHCGLAAPADDRTVSTQCVSSSLCRMRRERAENDGSRRADSFQAVCNRPRAGKDAACVCFIDQS